MRTAGARGINIRSCLGLETLPNIRLEKRVLAPTEMVAG